MATVAVNNTTANLSGKTLAVCEQVATITALWTFNRGASAPFAVNSGAGLVTNLDADKLDGVEGSNYSRLDQGNVHASGQNQFPSGTVGAPAVSIGDTDVGLYSSGTNALDLATAGAKAAGWNAQGQQSLPLQFRARATNSAAQTVNAGANAVLTLDSESYDVGGLHSTSVNTERMTIPTGGDGVYLIIGCTNAVTPGASAEAALALRVNGTAIKTRAATVPTSSSWPIVVSDVYPLVATDYVDLHATSTTDNVSYGSATAARATFLTIIKIA